MRLLAILLALFLCAPAHAGPNPPGFDALVKNLDRQAAEHQDKCVVTIDDTKGNMYVVHADCGKLPNRCYFAVDGDELDEKGIPTVYPLGCQPKPSKI